MGTDPECKVSQKKKLFLFSTLLLFSFFFFLFLLLLFNKHRMRITIVLSAFFVYHVVALRSIWDELSMSESKVKLTSV